MEEEYDKLKIEYEQLEKLCQKLVEGKRPMTIAEARERALWSIKKRKIEEENKYLKIQIKIKNICYKCKIKDKVIDRLNELLIEAYKEIDEQDREINEL